jgi:hypothetical protein
MTQIRAELSEMKGKLASQPSGADWVQLNDRVSRLERANDTASTASVQPTGSDWVRLSDRISRIEAVLDRRAPNTRSNGGLSR